MTTETTYRHRPTLRYGQLVEFIDGPHRGLCGELRWQSLMTGVVLVGLQNGDVVEGRRSEVDRAGSESYA